MKMLALVYPDTKGNYVRLQGRVRLNESYGAQIDQVGRELLDLAERKYGTRLVAAAILDPFSDAEHGRIMVRRFSCAIRFAPDLNGQATPAAMRRAVALIRAELAQNQVVIAITRHPDEIARKFGYRGRLALEPGTAEVLHLQGGPDRWRRIWRGVSSLQFSLQAVQALPA